MHELIHMRQYRRRKFKVLPDYASNADKTEQRDEQSYLGNSDEIDAYSYNIACELMDKFKYDTAKVVNYLNEDQTRDFDKKRNRTHLMQHNTSTHILGTLSLWNDFLKSKNKSIKVLNPKSLASEFLEVYNF